MFFRSFRSRAAAVALAACVVTAPALAGDLQLLMFERDGCIYCQRWNEQVGPAYPNTPEGAAAPLLRIDIKQALPEGITLTAGRPFLTPTFVLTDDGTEVGRLEGYPGDEFFWFLLDGLLEKTGWTPTDDPAQSDTRKDAPSGAAETSRDLPTSEEKAP